MMRAKYLVHAVSLALVSISIAAAAALSSSAASRFPTSTLLYLVQAPTLRASEQSLDLVNAKVDRKFAIIHAVSAYLSAEQAERLRNSADVRVFRDRTLSSRSLLDSLLNPVVSTVGSVAAPVVTVATPVVTPVAQVAAPVTNPVLTLVTPVLSPVVTPLTAPLVSSVSSNQRLEDGSGVGSSSLLYETAYPALVGADSLQRSGITGRGVTIAVLDSGLWQDPSQNFGSRVLASIDVVSGGSGPVQGDPYGHGTHVTSIAAGGAQNVSLSYSGIAPQANLVVVRAFDDTGGGRYTDVIAGLDWIVANRDRYNIRVLNLSFGAQPQSYYWDDPVNQAVMAAWRAGIVVVAAAGNEGPSAMTIDVPGNVPYVVTAGALTDNYTPYDGTDDRLASFSSAGPTFEGFVKPELVAPGGHLAASMHASSYLAQIDPKSMRAGEQMFTMSGTSQAAAVTSGVVALMLQSNPSLTPDTVKCRLLASTRPAVTSGGALAYSVFQQGAGLINAPAAVNSSATNCANQGLDVNADLAGTRHFGGPANQDANGNYYIMDLEGGSTWASPIPGDGLTWSQGNSWNQGYTWSSGYTWAQGYTWAKCYTWAKDLPWWTNSQPANGIAPASIEPWVPNQ